MPSRSGVACCRSRSTVLHRHREAGDRVVIATGASPELARAILDFVAHEDVPVIGTRSARFWAAWCAARIATTK